MRGNELNRTRRAQKENEGGLVLFFPRQLFARALLSERLEQATNVLIECGVYSRELYIGSFAPICGTYLTAAFNQVNLVLSFFLVDVCRRFRSKKKKRMTISTYLVSSFSMRFFVSKIADNESQ